MCIMMTDHEPSSTHLFNVPYTLDGVDYQLLIYTNDLDFEEKSKSFTTTPSITANPLKTFYSTLLERDLAKNSGVDIPTGFSAIPTTPDSALMIVAIPNPTGATNFGLVDVTTKQMKQFRTEAKDWGDSLIPWQYTLGVTNSFDADGYVGQAKSLRVNRVGNYDISVAPNLEALESQIDWSHFTLPGDFERRKATLSDSKLFPYPCAYVVAKAVTAVKDDGFAVLFPDPGFTYFPTCHEDNGTEHKYDVRCYQLGSKPVSSFPFQFECKGIDKSNWSFSTTENNKVAAIGRCSNGSSRYAESLNSTDGEKIRALHSVLPTRCVMSESGEEAAIKCNKAKAQVFNFCPINTRAVNQNIVLKA